MERFYQLVEERHWSIAEAMLAPPLRARFPEAALRARYGAYGDADIRVRQLDRRTVAAQLAAPGGANVVRERVALAWDGDDWQIESFSP